ncbi:hypothetical protein LL946_14645 [Knoellia locipacati]|uniref:hypothetical protein n=1 Tax=Knoellia locipacati TaxID=882824 RepID=UPI0038517875
MGEVLRLHGLGAVVEVTCTGDAGAELFAAMRRPWSRCLVEPALPPVGAPPLVLRLDDVAQLTKTLMLATQDVTRALIGARAGELLMFHAGAVSDPTTGRSVVYVARGGTGKTTLSRLLGQRLGYLTDETVGIDSSGVIHPYPKPLSVRRADEPTLKDELSPDELGLLPAPASARLGRIVLLERSADTDTATLEELDFMDALFGLAEQSSALPALPRPLHRLAEVIDEVGPLSTLRYGEAGQAAEDLVRLVGASR